VRENLLPEWLRRRHKAPPKPAHIRELVLILYYKGHIAMNTVILNWSNPVTRTDGSALAASEIASINVFDGTTQLANLIGAVTTFQTKELPAGDHSFTVVVNDNNGNSSGPSNVATVTVPALAPPSAVTNLTAALAP
jgi:hypothetical protein